VCRKSTEKKSWTVPGVPIGIGKDAPMKTLGEFLQRLEDDSLFEKKAQAYHDGDELMAFVESEGYDFTLEQLTNAFKQRENLPAQAEITVPSPPEAEVTTPSPPEAQVTTFPVSPAAFPQNATGVASPKDGSADFPREQPREEHKELPGEMSPKDLVEKLFKGGGGRHRGFSPERLKNALEEDS
jgi:predicted ribosomally synthesized peptide with nif11-like leader